MLSPTSEQTLGRRLERPHLCCPLIFSGWTVRLEAQGLVSGWRNFTHSAPRQDNVANLSRFCSRGRGPPAFGMCTILVDLDLGSCSEVCANVPKPRIRPNTLTWHVFSMLGRGLWFFSAVMQTGRVWISSACVREVCCDVAMRIKHCASQWWK